MHRCLLSLFAIGVICGTTYELGFRRLPSKAKDSAQAVNGNALPNARQPQHNQALELNERDGLSSDEGDANKYGAVITEGANNHEPVVATVENSDVEASGVGNIVAEKKPRKRDGIYSLLSNSVYFENILVSFHRLNINFLVTNKQEIYVKDIIFLAKLTTG